MAYPDVDCTLEYDQAWKLLVSVRLAAQCTDARVNVVIDQSDAMGVCHNGRLAKDIAQNQIGTLTTHTRQFQQFFQGIRYLTAILLLQYLHTGADISCLAVSQPTGTYNREKG